MGNSEIVIIERKANWISPKPNAGFYQNSSILNLIFFYYRSTFKVQTSKKSNKLDFRLTDILEFISWGLFVLPLLYISTYEIIRIGLFIRCIPGICV